MRLRVSRTLGGSVNFSVTFVAVPYALLKRGARMTSTAGIRGDRICSFVERVERIDEEIKALNEGKKEVFAEAKGEGFDVKVLKRRGPTSPHLFLATSSVPLLDFQVTWSLRFR
jgi:hypothetical protein